jgi:hypothetical protein
MKAVLGILAVALILAVGGVAAFDYTVGGVGIFNSCTGCSSGETPAADLSPCSSCCEGGESFAAEPCTACPTEKPDCAACPSAQAAKECPVCPASPAPDGVK